MTAKKNKHTFNPVLAKLFIRLLPIQVLVLVMGSLNSIVDGAVAGRCIDSATVGVIGLFYSVLCVLDAVNAVSRQVEPQCIHQVGIQGRRNPAQIQG